MVHVWREIQKTNFTRLNELLSFLELPPDPFVDKPRFALNVPRRLAEKMEKKSLTDPLLLQFVPLQEELILQEGFVSQPVQDETFQKSQKLLHKYKGRALILATSACAMHCRFCFRQNFPYETAVKDFQSELNYIREQSDLSEIILSGGDPLSLSNSVLAQLMDELEKIPHIKRIRFHTRFPIGIPERIDSEFIEILQKCTKHIVFVIHANHPNELDQDVLSAIKKLNFCTLLNQSTLLKGVNDKEEVLYGLCQKLADHGIIPYYLHALDPVQGAGHFAVSEARGKELIEYLQKHLSGYAVPRFVREQPGMPSKTPLL